MDSAFDDVRNQIREVYDDKQYYFARTIVLERLNRKLQQQVDLAEVASKMSRRVRRALLTRLEYLRERLETTTQRLSASVSANEPPEYAENASPPPLHCAVCYSNVAEWGFYHKTTVHLSLCHECAAMSSDVCPTCRQPGKLVRVYHSGISPYTEHASV